MMRAVGVWTWGLKRGMTPQKIRNKPRRPYPAALPFSLRKHDQTRWQQAGAVMMMSMHSSPPGGRADLLVGQVIVTTWSTKKKAKIKIKNIKQTAPQCHQKRNKRTWPFRATQMGKMSLPFKVFLWLKMFIIIFMLLFTVIVGDSCLQIVGLFLFYPFSRSLWRNYNSMFAEWWHVWLIFLLEVWNGMKITMYGDVPPQGERVLIISNHPTEVDWFMFWPFALRKGRLGNLKVILKKELRLVPGMGWAMDSLDFIFLQRNWAADEPLMRHRTQTWIEDDYSLWLAMFPEGTDFSCKKRLNGAMYATKHGLEVYKNLLVPRTTGFLACASMLQGHLDAIYDLTICYADRTDLHHPPTALSTALGIAPKRPCIHVRRYAFKDIPSDEEGMKEWLFKVYRDKDRLIEYFREHGTFPHWRGEQVDMKAALKEKQCKLAHIERLKQQIILQQEKETSNKNKPTSKKEENKQLEVMQQLLDQYTPEIPKKGEIVEEIGTLLKPSKIIYLWFIFWLFWGCTWFYWLYTSNTFFWIVTSLALFQFFCAFVVPLRQLRGLLPPKNFIEKEVKKFI
ncbi:1-acylglycerol-3-phosphate O-acyltransferase [Balamuthia mandrillaris]